MADPPELGSSGTKPGWWTDNEHTKEALDLPPYEPPRFADGVYLYEVVDPLEDAYNCTLQFIGIHVRYLDDWSVRIDGQAAFEIGRHRDQHGNTVFEMEADEFRAAVAESVGRDDD